MEVDGQFDAIDLHGGPTSDSDNTAVEDVEMETSQPELITTCKPVKDSENDSSNVWGHTKTSVHIGPPQKGKNTCPLPTKSA